MRAAALAALLISAGPALAPAAAQDDADVAPADAGAQASEASETPDDGFASDLDRVSYAIGVDIGRSFKTQNIEINVDVLREALGSAYAGDALRQTEEQSLAALQIFQQSMIERQQKQSSEAGAVNREQGTAFLAENGAREGVLTTESGLQYEILEAGDGATAGADDTVELHYTGTLLSGEVFDSSVDRGPANFPVSGVIPGFSEGLQLLPVGTRAKLYIPADLAYGDSPQGPGGPGSTLTFEVEMLGIEAAPPQPSLAEQLDDARERLAEDLDAVRTEGELEIAELEARLKESSGETVGGGEDAAEPVKELMYD